MSDNIVNQINNWLQFYLDANEGDVIYAKYDVLIHIDNYFPSYKKFATTYLEQYFNHYYASN